MFKQFMRVLGVLLVCLVASTVYANVQAPKELQQWKEWILWEHPELECPVAFSTDFMSQQQIKASRQCLWSSPMEIAITAKAIHFSQTVLLQKESWVGLPKAEKLWPEQVQVNNKHGKVVAQADGQPYLLLPKGRYVIKGLLPIDAQAVRITELRLPTQTALVALTIDGKPIHQPLIKNNVLMLTHIGEANRKKKQSNALNAQVFRLLKDAYPMTLKSRITLDVSGESRIEALGRALPKGFELTSIESPLPIRFNEQGEMQVQLEAGSWQINFDARYVGRTDETHTNKQEKDKRYLFEMEAKHNWPSQELWSFAPDRNYRIVDIQGHSIDASQTNLPQEWQAYSTYLLENKQPMSLMEKVRGDYKPDKHKLRLERDIWLSFDGKSLTSRSQLKGEFNALDRLSASKDYQAGRVEINGEPVLLTTVNDDQGVEVLTGNVAFKSVGQIQKVKAMSINPWNIDVDSAEMTLHLPPGYSLFSVVGADSIYRSYVSTWTLWRIFIVILFVVVLVRQYSILVGMAGLLYALSVHQVFSAPSVFLLLIMVAIHVLVRYLPEKMAVKK